MSQSCASDDFSLPSDGDGHEEHIGRQSLGLQRQKQVEFGYDKTHSTVGVLCLSNPLVSLSLSLSNRLFLSRMLFYLSLSLLCKKHHSSNPCFLFVLFFFDSPATGERHPLGVQTMATPCRGEKAHACRSDQEEGPALHGGNYIPTRPHFCGRVEGLGRQQRRVQAGGARQQHWLGPIGLSGEDRRSHPFRQVLALQG